MCTFVVSDTPRRLQAAIRETMHGSAWQHGRVHLMRNVLSQVPREHAGMVAPLVRTILVQPDAEAARCQLSEVSTRLEPSLPKADTVLTDSEDDVTSYATFARHYWRKTWSTNPIELVNKEIKRRTNVGSVFSGDDAVLRLVCRATAKQHGEWQTSARRYPTANHATVFDLEQDITLELEAN